VAGEVFAQKLELLEEALRAKELRAGAKAEFRRRFETADCTDCTDFCWYGRGISGGSEPLVSRLMSLEGFVIIVTYQTCSPYRPPWRVQEPG
jgi:hypothetical protein